MIKIMEFLGTCTIILKFAQINAHVATDVLKLLVKKEQHMKIPAYYHMIIRGIIRVKKRGLK